MGNNTMSWTTLEAERVKAIEVKQDDVINTVNSVEKKLDDLLELKNKGMGAFWIVSIIMGAAFTALISIISDIFNGS